MLWAVTTEVVVAILAGVATLGSSTIAALAVVYSVRSQKRPKIVELSPDEKDAALAAERAERARIAAELTVWREIALEIHRREDRDARDSRG